MSYASLLSHRADVVHIGDTGTDRFNNAERGETSRDEDVHCRIQQLSVEELTLQRDTAGATHRAFFLVTQDIGPFDQVESGDVLFEVTGPPEVVYGFTSPHHIEAMLRSLTDWTYPGAYP